MFDIYHDNYIMIIHKIYLDNKPLVDEKLIEDNVFILINYLEFYFENMPQQTIKRQLEALTLQADFFEKYIDKSKIKRIFVEKLIKAVEYASDSPRILEELNYAKTILTWSIN